MPKRVAIWNRQLDFSTGLFPTNEEAGVCQGRRRNTCGWRPTFVAHKSEPESNGLRTIA
jgi:hypothetical protein